MDCATKGRVAENVTAAIKECGVWDVSINTGAVTPTKPATLKEPFPPWQVCVTIQQGELARLLIRAPTYLGHMPILPTLTSTKTCRGVPSIKVGQHTGKQYKTMVRVLVQIPI